MLITNFASGELSPKLYGRIDLQQYYQGASRIKNFEIIPTGGIQRRCGTQRIVDLGHNSRIIPFIIDKNRVYVLEFSPYQLRIYLYTNGTVSLTQTITTVYQYLDDCKDIQYAQNYDTMVLVQRKYKPYELVFDFSLNSFTLTQMSFDFEPDVVLDDDFEFIQEATDGLPTGHSDTDHCIYQGLLYKYSTANNRWEVQGTEPETETGLFSTDGKYPGCVSFFNNRLWFASSNYARQKIWASCTPDNGGNRYKKFKTYKKFVTVNRQIKDADQHIFTADINTDLLSLQENGEYYSYLINCSQDFGEIALSKDLPSYFISGNDKYAVSGYKVEGYFTSKTITGNSGNTNTYESVLKIKGKFNVVVANSQSIDISAMDASVSEVLNQLISEGAITLGYIGSSSMTEGETENENTNNDSQSSNDNSNQSSSNDSQSSNDTEDEQIPIVELRGEVFSISLWRNITVASSEDYEYVVVQNNLATADCSFNFELASDQNDAIMFLSSNKFLAAGTESSIWSIPASVHALNIQAVMQGRYGSDSLQAQAVGTATIYFAQGRKGIREFYFMEQSEAFTTNNIALTAEHLLRESRIVDFDYMTNPYNRLLLVREDGILLTMLYDKNNGLMAWNRIQLDGAYIRQVAVTRGNDDTDLIFMVVERDNAFTLELLDPNSGIYIDSYKAFISIDGYGENAVLFNKTKNTYSPITCDQVNHTYTAQDSQFEIDTNDEVYIGHAYESSIKSMPVLSNKQNENKRITSLVLRFLESYKPILKCTNLPDEHFYRLETPYSGVYEITVPGASDKDVFELNCNEPYVVTILSVNAKVV